MTEGSVLWRLLGRREAFAMVAARCSAAEAADLKELRDSKAYLEVAGDWKEFVPKHLKMSYDSANRIIRNLEEFGPVYFDVAQFTRMSPETYRAIAPSIGEQGLNYNGKVIALIPENAEKVAEAVNELRLAIPAKEKKPKNPKKPQSGPSAPLERFDALEWHCGEFIAQIEEAARDREKPEEVKSLIGYMRGCLDQVEQMM
jgi:hypothetical protein